MQRDMETVVIVGSPQTDVVDHRIPYSANKEEGTSREIPSKLKLESWVNLDQLRM